MSTALLGSAFIVASAIEAKGKTVRPIELRTATAKAWGEEAKKSGSPTATETILRFEAKNTTKRVVALTGIQLTLQSDGRFATERSFRVLAGRSPKQMAVIGSTKLPKGALPKRIRLSFSGPAASLPGGATSLIRIELDARDLAQRTLDVTIPMRGITWRDGKTNGSTSTAVAKVITFKNEMPPPSTPPPSGTTTHDAVREGPTATGGYTRWRTFFERSANGSMQLSGEYLETANCPTAGCFDAAYRTCTTGASVTADLLQAIRTSIVLDGWRDPSRRCAATFQYTANPNLDWAGKKMTCLFDPSKQSDLQRAFQDAVARPDAYVCTGPLADIFRKLSRPQ